MFRAGIATLLHLARGEFDELALAAKIRPAYVELLQELKKLGVPEVQVQAGEGKARMAEQKGTQAGQKHARGRNFSRRTRAETFERLAELVERSSRGE